ncbi:hypothetical protein C2E23DRAFT_826565 [Lenzites betulinus]|nr:hypothetical protein C2E23DRAFT_826565 [Lenzites betulinus]
MPRGLLSLRPLPKGFKWATKLKPGGTKFAAGVRCLGRKITKIPLEPAIAVVKAGGSSVPFMQGISSVVVLVLKRAQSVKQNKKECKELARLSESVLTAVLDATNGVPEEELDDKMRLHLAELEWCVCVTAYECLNIMGRLDGKPFLRRFWRKDKHTDALVEHKGALEHALNIFQTKWPIAAYHAQRAGQAQLFTAIGEMRTEYSERAQDRRWRNDVTMHNLFFSFRANASQEGSS